MKSFITGITGFVGSYLSEYLLSLNHEVGGIYLHSEELENLTEEAKANLKLYQGNILDEDFLNDCLREFNPDWVFHLAAVSNVHHSWKEKKATYEINILGVFNLLEACSYLERKPKILLVGSAEEYGKSDSNEAIKESFPLKGFTPYAISKIAQEYLGMQYYYSKGLPILRTRSFNHAGPRQKPSFVCSSFCYQIAQIEVFNKEPIIKVGNLGSSRDFSDVRDVIKAYALIMEKGEIGDVYNVCSMKAYSIKEILDKAISLSDRRIEIEVDKERYRPIEIPYLLGDNTKLKKLGWQPSYSIEQTLLDTLNYWKDKFRKQR